MFTFYYILHVNSPFLTKTANKKNLPSNIFYLLLWYGTMYKAEKITQVESPYWAFNLCYHV